MGYHVFRNRRGGGVSTFVGNGLCSHVLPSPGVFPDVGVLAVKVVVGPFALSVINVYLLRVLRCLALVILHVFLNFPGRLIFGVGDFNGHFETRDDRCNPQGALIGEMLVDRGDLLLLTDKCRLNTRPCLGWVSNLDLTLCSASLGDVVDVSQGPDLGSDHLSVLTQFTLGSCPGRPLGDGLARNFRRVDWEVFQASLLDARFVETADVDSDVQCFHDGVHSALVEASPSVVPSRHGLYRGRWRRPVPWWTVECQEVITIRNRVLRRFRASPTPANLLSYKRCAEVVKKIVLRAKRDSWQRFCASLNRQCVE